METLSGRNASQHPDELLPFIELLKSEGVGRYLEIGARHGDTFYDVMRALARGSFGLAVDLPGGAWGTHKSKTHLERACKALVSLGYNVDYILGDSTESLVIEKIARHAPFHAVLIDGDHRYDGAKNDWKNYGQMARIVAFHDIAGDGVTQQSSGLPVEVPRLWREIREHHRHEEFIASDSKMGIGVLWR